MAFAERLGNFIWNPWLLGLFLLSGLYFSVRTGFFQLFHVRLWLKTTPVSYTHLTLPTT